MTPTGTLTAIRRHRIDVREKKRGLLEERRKLSLASLSGGDVPLRRVAAINVEIAALDATLMDLDANEQEALAGLEREALAAKQRTKASDMRYLHAAVRARDQMCVKLDVSVAVLQELVGVVEELNHRISVVANKYEGVQSALLFLQPPDLARVLWDRLSVLDMMPALGGSNAMGNPNSFMFGPVFAQHGEMVRQRLPLVSEVPDEPPEPHLPPLNMMGPLSADDAWAVERDAAA